MITELVTYFSRIMKCFQFESQGGLADAVQEASSDVAYHISSVK